MNISSIPKSEETQQTSYQCKICGARAQHIYYGALACEPCKIFFRRTVNAARIRYAPKCKLFGRCEVDVYNRHACAACRFAKCFRSGMSTDKLRGSIAKKQKNVILMGPHESNRVYPLLPLNLLQADRSPLTSDQWTLLSNLSHCYQESSIHSFAQRLINTPVDSISSYSFYTNLVEEFLVSVYDTAGAYLRSNNDVRRLPFEDRSILLRSAANSVCCIGGAFIMEYFQLHSVPVFLRAMNEKYGRQTMDIHRWARKFIDRDLMLIKLAIGLLAVSDNACCYNPHAPTELTNAMSIFQIQSKYGELTWKYLLYRYGYFEAVKRFLNITLWLMAMNNLIAHAQSLTTHTQDIDSLVEQTELDLIINDDDEVVESM